MSQTLPLPPPGFDALSQEEQIDYVQPLWDHIAAQPEKVPVPDWHRQILAERLADYDTNPDEGKTWEQFEEELGNDANLRRVIKI
jgi:putative addiction module component (TIGR02574 family)